MRTRIAAVLLAFSAVATAGPSRAETPAAASEPTLQARLAQILASYRKTIVLLADEETLDDVTRPRARMAGWLLAQARAEALARLSENLAAELDQALAQGKPAPRVEQFLSWLESDPGLHDADKLAFAELLEDLADAVGGARPGPARSKLLGRVGEDTRALSRIRARYDREMDKSSEPFARAA